MTAHVVDVDEQRLAVPVDTAIRLSGLTARQVNYWAATELVTPTVEQRLTPGRRIRLYGFVDLMALLVAAELRRRKVTLQHIRRVVSHLRSRGYKRPLNEIVFATLNGQLFFQLEDGTWEGGLQPEQIVLHEVLNLVPIRRRIWQSVQREPSLAGKIERRRGALGSKPVIAGTRIPVETVRRYLEAGRPESEILNAYPDLTPRDVDAVRREVAV